MDLQPWQREILQTLSRYPTSGRGKAKISIVGIGHELYGDDALGMEIARYLLLSEPAARNECQILLAGPVPESFCGVIRRFCPDFVVLIDAADMGQPAGTVCWLTYEEISGMDLTDRSLPLHILVTFLRAELGCEVGLLGVQPLQVAFGSLSPPIQPMLMRIGDQIVDLLHLLNTGCLEELPSILKHSGKRM